MILLKGALPMQPRLFLVLAFGCAASGQIAFKTYSVEEDQRVLKMYDGLRVANVSDGMDMAGLPDVGLTDLVDPAAVAGHQ